MIIIDKIKDRCCGCEACKEVCPVNCISMVEDNEGFLFPEVNEDICIKCNKCKDVCPINTKISIDEDFFKKITTYASWSLDDKLRECGASGGIFGSLAKEILKKNGVIFGAIYDKNKQVIHSFIENEESLYKLQSSKYVQSSTNGMYKKTKEFLEKGRKVLYSGTPCQIEGLKNFLKKDYSNLITVGIICHGVPSPGVYKKYLKYLETKYGSEIKKINFRKKKKNEIGKFQIIFRNEKIYETVGNGGKTEDLYYRGFLSNIFLRKSCYACTYKLNADFIIGDFWGVENFNKELVVHDGINIILCISDKSKIIFNEIKNYIYFKKYNLNEIIPYNPNIIEPAFKNSLRNNFFRDYKKMNIKKVLNKYVEFRIKNMFFSTLVYRVIKKVKKIIFGVKND